MIFSVIYGIVIFAATFLGAFVGLGGGVIIKPLLDLIGHDTVQVHLCGVQYEHQLHNQALQSKNKNRF